MTKDTRSLLKEVRKIELKTRGLSKNLFAGEYHSAFKGRGMAFSEVREYQYGDDIRNIDWNVTARFNHPYIKVFEEERELTMMLLIDVSRSDFFGSSAKTKNEVITEVAAILAFSAVNNNDKVGVLFFTDQVEQFIPPKKGRSQILRIVRELLDFEPQHSRTNIREALAYFNNTMKKRTIAFLLSDFIDKDFGKPMAISAKRHDLIGMHFHDPREEEIPPVGLIQLQDAETGQFQWVDTQKRQVREEYKRWYQANYNYARETLKKSGADWMSIATDKPYVNTLLNFFKQREKRQ
jgi:uncharacterized protein (DUF58 family)